MMPATLPKTKANLWQNFYASAEAGKPAAEHGVTTPIWSRYAGIISRNICLDYCYLYSVPMGGLAVPLFALNPKERLRIFTAEHTFEPAPGWTIISMVAETAAAKEKSDK
jgi:hypothetical protein